MKQDQKKEEWEARMADYAASGQSVGTWCTEQKIKRCNFQYWRRKLRTLSNQPAEQPIQWLSLGFDRQPPKPDEGIIVHIGAARITVGKGFDRETFRDIITALQQL